MSASKSRTLFAHGDILGWLMEQDPDEYDALEVPMPDGNIVGAVFGRIGRTQVVARSDGEVVVHVHEDESGAHECYAWNIERVTRLRDAAAEGPMALLAAVAAAMSDESPTAVPTGQYI